MTKVANPVAKARWQHWALASVLIPLIFAAYLPSLNGGFVWDDDAWTTGIAHLTDSPRGLWEMWSRPTALQQYFPLTGTTFWLDHQLWGGWTLPYHLENVALHALSALLFWRLLRRLEVQGAWLAAMILGLHPMMVESVAWIAERKNVLSMVLFLSSLLAYDRSLSFWAGDALPRRPGPYVLALIIFLAALLAKVSTFILAPTLLLLAWWKRGSLRWRDDVLPTLPFWVLATVAGAGAMWLERHHVGAEGEDWHMSLMDRGLQSCKAWWFYVGKLLWPAPLPPIHPHWDSATAVFPPWVGPSSFLLLGIAIWRSRAKIGRGGFTALLFFTGALLPVLGFLNVYGMLYAPVADRWVHLPSLGVIAFFAASLTRLATRIRSPWLVPGLASVILPVLAFFTWNQAGLYRDNETLMRTALRMNPRCWVAAYNLANIMSVQGRLDEAIALHRQALDLRPQHVKAHNNLGIILMKKGNLAEASAELQKAIQLMPDLSVAHYNLGNCLLRLSKFMQAAASFEKTVELDPDNADAHNNLAGILFQQGKPAEALVHFRRVVEIQPGNADALGNLAVVLVHGGRLREGLAKYEAALQIQPNHTIVLANLAWLLATCPDASMRDGSRALACAKKANELSDERRPDALRSLAAALAENGIFDEAVIAASRAARMAEQGGNSALAAKLGEEADLYRTRSPKRDPGLAPETP